MKLIKIYNHNNHKIYTFYSLYILLFLKKTTTKLYFTTTKIHFYNHKIYFTTTKILNTLNFRVQNYNLSKYLKTENKINVNIDKNFDECTKEKKYIPILWELCNCFKLQFKDNNPNVKIPGNKEFITNMKKYKKY